MKLVIVESPKKCETIQGYLGPEYKVMASQGHIRDLSTKGRGGLGINVEEGFLPDFVINPEKKRIVDSLRRESRKAEEVILATDPDREGEAISWHLAQVLSLPVEDTKRLQFHEITKPALEEAIAHPGRIDMNLVNSQETRRMYDRVIGFKLSGLLKRKISAKSAGRVQSVTLRMICDNDEEIAAFKPEEYWTISATIALEGGNSLALSLEKVDGKAPEIHSKEEADKILARIEGALRLISLQNVERKVQSKPAFTTSTMQQEAYNRYRFSPSRTQSIAQRLYEGVALDKGEKIGLITYMRTDSTRISPEFYERHAKPYILERFGEKYLGKPKAMKKQGRIQDAHEAIRPTGTHRTPESLKPYLSSDEYKLYKLIYERALASMMSDRVEMVSTALFDVAGLTFKASGTRTIFPGFEALLHEEREEKELPLLEEGKEYPLLSKEGEQKFTKAPARFTEARVVRLMEERGIGRPSTYASTIKTLKDRGYVTSDKGVLTPTESGKKTTLVLKKYFPEVVSPEYTANMETKLDEIEEGRESRLEAMEEFYGPFMEKFEKVQREMYKDPDEETGELCPVCGSPLVRKKGRYGPFVSCSAYPSCTYVKKEGKTPVFTGENCPECGKPLVERKDRRGRTFVGCSGYPECHYIKGAEGRKKEAPEHVKKCPDCQDGWLVRRHGRRGDFLGCTNFPRCRHIESIEGSSKKDDKDE